MPKLAAEMRRDFRLTGNTSSWGELVHDTRQNAGKLSEQFLFAHPGMARELGYRGLTQGGAQLPRLNRLVGAWADP